MLESKKLRVTEVGLGRRWISTKFSTEYLEECLENGCSLRKSNAYPIKCRVTLRDGEGRRDLHPYMHFEFAIIPPGGITKKGYVKEAWIECYSKLIEIDNLSHEVIDPHVHRKSILNFKLVGQHKTLLPSKRIVVKYLKKKNMRST